MLPRRPVGHSIADQATFQLQSLFASFGWAADRVQSDYGDDLIVQLVQEERVTGYRLLVQVKGTNNLENQRRANGYFLPAVKLQTVTKWLQSTEPVMLVLWNVQSNSGVYVFVQEYFTRELLDRLSGQESHEVLIPSEAHLDSSSARRVRAQYHYLRACDSTVRALGVIHLHNTYAEDGSASTRQIGFAISESVLPFLEEIRALENREDTFTLAAGFRADVIRQWVLYLTVDPTDNILENDYMTTSLRRAVLMGLLSTTQRATGWGMRVPQLETAVHVLMGSWFEPWLNKLVAALYASATRTSEELRRDLILSLGIA